MHDPFTGRPTRLRGGQLPGAQGQAALLDDHRRRLRAFDQMVETAEKCGIRADSDRPFVLLAEDEVSLLETAGGDWAELGAAIRAFRAALPFVRLADFGFHADAPDPFEVESPRLRLVGGGVEALAFADSADTIYKFFLFREGGAVGAAFDFALTEAGQIRATATPGGYRELLAKLRLTHEIGMPTEALGVTPEGILVAKQTLGAWLPVGADVSALDPQRLIPFPARFLHCDRDHPRLVFLEDEPWLVADTHDRNVVRDAAGQLRVIDVVAAPLPAALVRAVPLLGDWLGRVRRDPAAAVLADVPDDEL